MAQRNRIDGATRRYELRTAMAMAVFTAFVIAFLPRSAAPELPQAFGLILLCSLPLLYTAYEYQRHVRALDELQSQLEIQAGAIGAGLVLLLAAVWGFGEIFGVLPDLSPIYLLPVALVVQSIVRRVQGKFYE